MDCELIFRKLEGLFAKTPKLTGGVWGLTRLDGLYAVGSQFDGQASLGRPGGVAEHRHRRRRQSVRGSLTGVALIR